jgi:hypothetical protein
MTNIYSWDPDTAGNNDDADAAINWLEGQLPSTVNNSARAMMMRVAQVIYDISGKPKSAGTGNAYTVTTKSIATVYGEPLMVAFEADKANTAGATLALDGLATKPLYNTGAGLLSGGEIQAGGVYFAVYNATLDGFVVINVPDIPKPRSGLQEAKNLYIENDGVSTVTITAEELFVGTTADQLVRLLSVSTSVDLSVSGDGGMDTGTEPASKILYLHVIFNSTSGAVSAVASLDRYHPTVPAGYDYKVYVGAVKNDGSSNLILSRQWGKDTYITGSSYTLSTGAGLNQARNMTDRISSTAYSARIRVGNQSFDTTYVSIGTFEGTVHARASNGNAITAEIPVNPATHTLYYSSTDILGDAVILGWSER